MTDDREMRYRRAFVQLERGMLDAQEWFYRDDLAPSERRKMATRSVLRAINKAQVDTELEMGDMLSALYHISVGRKRK